MLAITNPRLDGFHDLISLVSPTKLGDTIYIMESDRDSLSCNLDGVPTDDSNLVIKAAMIFRQKTGIKKYYKFNLEKVVPHGAGLGGGSSNGAVVLKALNEINNNPLLMEDMVKISASLGSDCPLFLNGDPLIMRGRGDIIENLNEIEIKALKDLDYLIFKPTFSINTGWAYKKMREDNKSYIKESDAEKILNDWRMNPTINNLPLYNNMQVAAFEKYPALQIVIDGIRKNFKLQTMMSGSGSACFTVLNNCEKSIVDSLIEYIRLALGDSCFISKA